MIPPPFNHATGSASKAGGKNKATGSTNNGVEFCKGSLFMLWQEHQKGDGHTQTHGVNLQREGAVYDVG